MITWQLRFESRLHRYYQTILGPKYLFERELSGRGKSTQEICILENFNPLCQANWSVRGNLVRVLPKILSWHSKEFSETYVSSLENLQEMSDWGNFVDLLILRFDEPVSEAIAFSSVTKWYFHLHHVAVGLSPSITLCQKAYFTHRSNMHSIFHILLLYFSYFIIT